jgi:broad specificity phosphatase PhoE
MRTLKKQKQLRNKTLKLKTKTLKNKGKTPTKPTYFEIVFVRHAETQPNVEHRAYDNNTEEEYYPITENGLKQAQTTGKYFTKQFGKKPFDLVIASPRHRCIQTAEGIISQFDNVKQLKNNMKIDTRVIELRAGVFNGMNREDEKEFLKTKPKIQAWQNKLTDLYTKFERCKNEFETYAVNQEIHNHYYSKSTSKLLDYDILDNINKGHHDFLNDLVNKYVPELQLKTGNKNNTPRILVVMHGAVLWRLYQNMQPNIELSMFNWVYDKESFIKNKNCVMFSAVYDEKRFKVITELHTKQFL